MSALERVWEMCVAMGQRADGPVTRKKGAVLERAIHAAVLSELSASGYAGLTLDKVAQRAETGRASLYRRWPNKSALVADTIARSLPAVERTSDSGDVRTDLLDCFEQMYRMLDGLGNLAFQALAAELHHGADSEIMAVVRDRVLEPRIQVVLDVLLAGVARGQIRAAAAVPVLARTGPALMLQHLLMFGTPPPRAYIEDIVDRVVLPAAVSGTTA
ncbi:TetR/AcrR family transcriptional regulator [Nocardia nova]|uniref:TetR/AcrR family transcriptional regulator n=1 Tax=Nocardia nova TaxID=37330 RepID=UPI003403EEC8